MTENRLYPKKYGAWAGRPEGVRPDYALCCETVSSHRHEQPGGHQCFKPRGYGPDEAYCKAHDPAAVQARADAASKRSNEKYNKERYGWNGPTFYAALKQIADDHDDPVAFARKTLYEFHKGDK